MTPSPSPRPVPPGVPPVPDRTPRLGEWLAVEVLTPDGGLLGREGVQSADLAPLAAESWRDGCLRAGIEAGLADLDFELAAGRDGHAGLVLAWRADGAGGAVPLAPSSGLEHLAQRVVTRCVAAGQLAAGDEYLRRLITVPADPGPGAAGVRFGAPFRLPGRLPDRVSVRLDDLRRWAEPRGTIGPDDFPVFYPATLAARVLELARRGEAEAIETGAALAGVLLRGSDDPGFALILTSALAMEHTEATSTRLELKAATWSAIHARLRARRRVHPAIPEMLVGQVHAHPFLPGKCAPCSRLKDCELTTATASSEDDQWMRLVFGTQPWALCHIVGYDPRRAPVERLFTRSGGRLRPRGFHVLPDSVLSVVLPGLSVA